MYLTAQIYRKKRLMDETAQGLKFPKTLKWSDGTELVIDIARPEECNEIMSFLDGNFFSKSPEVHLIGDDKPKPGSEEEKKKEEFYYNVVLEECLSASNSLTVRNPDKNGEMVAVSVNRVHYEGVKRRDFPPEDVSLFKEMWSVLNEPADGLFSLYKTTKVFHWYMTAVSPPYQRRGIATKLAQLCIQLGVEAGAGAIKVEAESEYTSRLADKLGFSTLKSVDYATFQYKGTKPLADNRYLLSEHSIARLMARSLP